MWWFEGFYRKRLKVQIYCIERKGKGCWSWPESAEEQRRAKGV